MARMRGKEKDECDCGPNCKCGCHRWCHWRHKCGGGIYGLGFIGALVYYLSNATSFGMGVLGILKAIVWPAFLVFHLLGL